MTQWGKHLDHSRRRRIRHYRDRLGDAGPSRKNNPPAQTWSQHRESLALTVAAFAVVTSNAVLFTAMGATTTQRVDTHAQGTPKHTKRDGGREGRHLGGLTRNLSTSFFRCFFRHVSCLKNNAISLVGGLVASVCAHDVETKNNISIFYAIHPPKSLTPPPRLDRLADQTNLEVELLGHAQHEAVLDRRHHFPHGVLLVVHRSGHLPARLHVDGAMLHVDPEQLAQLLAGVDRSDLVSQQPGNTRQGVYLRYRRGSFSTTRRAG